MASWLDKAMGRESDEPQREAVPFDFGSKNTASVVFFVTRHEY